LPNKSECSDGTLVTQATIDRNYAKARQKKYAGITCVLPCESCGQPSNDNDHTIAQARCKVIGKTELIWDPKNFPRSCRQCHREWESYKSGAWLKHGNRDERLAYLKKHDPDGYTMIIEFTENTEGIVL